MSPAFVPPSLVLDSLAKGVTPLVPPDLTPGDALPLSPQLQGRWITLGAGSDQDHRLQDSAGSVGRAHLRFTLRDGVVQIQGRLTKGGYLLNGAHCNDCTARPLRDGDRLAFGAWRFRFVQPPESAG